MKSRVIQDEPERPNGEASSDRPPGRARQAMNLPARRRPLERPPPQGRDLRLARLRPGRVHARQHDRRESAHRRRPVHRRVHDAEQALDDAGLRPIEEVVLLKSDTLTLDDPAVPGRGRGRHRAPGQGSVRRGPESPLDGRHRGDPPTVTPPWSTSRSPATRSRPRTGLDPTCRNRRRPEATPRHGDRAVRRRAAPTRRSTSTINDDIAKAGELSLPITLIILTITFGSLVAAGVPLLIGLTSVLAALGLVALPSLACRSTRTSTP